jgi:pimeloyl-ACP methyl ester carboxylesterase
MNAIAPPIHQPNPAWTRRALGSIAGAALAAATLGAHPSRGGARASSLSGVSQTEITPMATDKAIFVLVHGGWHGGWCWNRVAPLLRAAGHDVWTPTLTGLADRAHALTPETDLRTHIRDIVGLLVFEDLGRVILVGHSYAGMVIAGVAAEAPDRIAHVVYLDAFVPQEGDSLMTLLSPEREFYYRTHAVQRDQIWRVPPPPVDALGVRDAADAVWMQARLTDQPLRSFDQELTTVAPSTLPRTYIHCTEGPIVGSFAPFASRAQTDPSWSYVELATGHDAMIIEPRALAELLLDVVTESA